MACNSAISSVVKDVARACRLRDEAEGAVGRVFNVGSGRVLNVRQVAERIAAALGKEHIGMQITGKFRTGDIRNCFADITQARSFLGYQPRVSLEDGLVELSGWLETQIAHDHMEAASAELARRGLAI
jgi:dTDP-L-rhamnose 4-epimerase